LSNGLQVVVLPSTRAPTVTQFVVYKAGSADETFGKTGIAHFLEHMMFKGTKTVGPTQFAKTITRNGGRDNAYTDFDVTAYYQLIASDRLDLVMGLEADRMANLDIVEKELLPEREVVLEERRMRIENVPSAMLDEKVRVKLFGKHQPYSMPPSGYPDQVRALGVDDLMTFYRQHYMPNNAALIVAGDVTPASVHRLADRHFGAIPAGKAPMRTRPDKGGPDLPQEIVFEDKRVAEPSWGRDWIAPSFRKGETRHAPALEVLGRLFGGGELGRLSRALVVQDRLALSASAGYGPSSLGLASFGLDVHPAPGIAIAAIERAVDQEMKKILDGQVGADEVERVQNQLLAAAIYSQDSLGSGPRIYAATLSTGGNVEEIDIWPQRIAEVKPADVVAAARHVWRESGCVTSFLTSPPKDKT
jgi:zinc protease